MKATDLFFRKSFNFSLRNFFCFLLFICLFFSCTKDPVEQEKIAPVDLGYETSEDIIKDQYIVLLSKKPVKKDSRAAAALEALSKEVGNMPEARIKGTFKSTLTGFTAKLLPQQVETLKKDPRVLSITADRYIKLEDIETTTFSMQEYPIWGLDRIDQRDRLLDRAYAYTATGSGVNAYIMDSGIRYSHSEFEGRATLGVDLVLQYPDEEYDVNDPDLEPGNDCGGHGTHVAGTVGGENYGVAKDVNLISVRVFSCRGITSESRLIQAVEWITENAVKPAVVNMSLGGNAYEPLDLAVENSVATGIHYVAAAGNRDEDACNFSPARAPGTLTVGASNYNNIRASFSNFGNCLDVYAPGESITSAGIADNNEAVMKSGTSMAAPHITGLVALYLEKNPTATPAEVKAAIVENSTPDAVLYVPLGPANLAHSLWETVNFTPPAPPDLNLKVFGYPDGKRRNIIELKYQPTDDPFVYIYRNGEIIAQWHNDGLYVLTTDARSNDVFKVCESNYNNCSAELAPNFDSGQTYVPNQPPTSNFTYTVDNLTVQFTDASFDEDGSIISRYWRFGDGYVSSALNPTRSYYQPGTYQVELVVTDNYHAEKSSIQYVSVGAGEVIPTTLTLQVTGYKEGGRWKADLTWNPEQITGKVDIYKNGNFYRSVENSGSYTDSTNNRGSGTLTYEICNGGSRLSCSGETTVQY